MATYSNPGVDPRLAQKFVLTDDQGTVVPMTNGVVPVSISAGGGGAVTIADGADVTQGVTTGTAVSTDANGTVQQYLRGLVKLVVAKIGITIADGDSATLGVTTGAAVITNATGTVQQYLRGLVTLALSGFAAIGNVAAGAADSGAPVKTGGKYVAAGVTLSDGNRGDTQLNVNGATNTNLGTLISGENQTLNRMMTGPSYSYTNIVLAAPTTTAIKSGSGLLHSITINKPVAASVITVYDNTAGSGTLIATITLPAALLTEGPYSGIYDVAFATGLTIVTATGASDITVAWL